MQAKAVKFQELHHKDETFIMANAWNAGSAVLLEEAGFDAIATTSAGIAFSHALPDYEATVPFDMALEEAKKIASAVKLPVSMDAENGYADLPKDIFKHIKRISQTGVVGANIEDYTGDPQSPLYSTELAVERITAAKEATSNLAYPFVLTARTDYYFTDESQPLKRSIERLNYFREAGADCLFAPGVKDLESIKTMVKEVDGPVTVVMGLAGTPISVKELQGAGVSRISIGGSLARATFGFVRKAAKEMLEDGTFNYAREQIADAELCQLFSSRLNQK